MENLIIKKLKENIKYFDDIRVYPTKLVGCSTAELLAMQEFYPLPIPEIILDIYKIGGHNFFQFYFEGFDNGFKGFSKIRKSFDKNNFSKLHHKFNFKENFIFDISYYSIYYVDLKLGKNSPVYYFYGDDDGENSSIVYETIELFLLNIIETQSIRHNYAKEAIISGEIYNDYNMVIGPPKLLREEIERQYQKYKEGENWSDYLIIAEQNYKALLDMQEYSGSDEDLPF